MFGPVLWRGVIPVTVFLLGAGSALADNAVPPDTVDRAYGVLERMGLLQQEAPAAPAAASAPRAADAAAASTSAAMPQESPARAYGVLERHGLLPKQEAPVRGVASAPASAGSAAPATASAPTDVAPPPAAAALAASPSAPTAVAAATAPAPERSRFSAGALGMLERLGLVQKQAPGAAPADAVTPGAAAAAPAAAGGLAEEEVRPDAPATTVAGSTAVETQVASHAAAEPLPGPEPGHLGRPRTLRLDEQGVREAVAPEPGGEGEVGDEVLGPALTQVLGQPLQGGIHGFAAALQPRLSVGRGGGCGRLLHRSLLVPEVSGRDRPFRLPGSREFPGSEGPRPHGDGPGEPATVEATGDEQACQGCVAPGLRWRARAASRRQLPLRPPAPRG